MLQSPRSLILIYFPFLLSCSDYSGSNVKLPKILLNGNNICMASPRPPPISRALGLMSDYVSAYPRRGRARVMIAVAYTATRDRYMRIQADGPKPSLKYRIDLQRSHAKV